MKKRVYLVLIVKLFITALLFYLIFRKLPAARIVALLTRIQPGYFGLACLLLGPNLLFHFLCWRYVLKIASIEPGWRLVAESLVVGYSFAVITPGGVGEVGRGVYFKDRDRFQVLGLSFVDKYYSLLVTVVLGCTGTVFYLTNSYLVLVFMVTGLALILTLVPRPVGKIIMRLAGYLPFFREELKVFIYSLKGFTPIKALRLLCLSGGFHLVFFSQFYFLLRAFGADVAFLPVVAITACIFMIKALLPISVADLGLREGLSVYFFSRAPFLLAAGIAFNASILLFTMNILVPSLIGLFFIHRIQWRPTGPPSPPIITP